MTWSILKDMATAGLVVGGALVVLVELYLLFFLPFFPRQPAEVAVPLLVGSVARVTVPIPAGGVGAIAATASGRHVSIPARGWDGENLLLLTEVVIVEMTPERTALVRALDC